MFNVEHVRNDEELKALASAMKLYAVCRPLTGGPAYSDTVAEAIKNAFRPDVLELVMKSGYNKAAIMPEGAISLALTVEEDDGNKVWHLSMSLISVGKSPPSPVPEKVPEDLAKRIFKAFWPEKEYQNSHSCGALKNVRHYIMPYE